MNISSELLGEIVDHALQAPGEEVCGLVSAEPGSPRRAIGVYRAVNMHASPLKFEIEGGELFRLNREIEEAGYEIGAIYHSHVRSPPEPSQTDVNYAAYWPGIEWIIVGLAGPGAPEVRSYLIDGGNVEEMTI